MQFAYLGSVPVLIGICIFTCHLLRRKHKNTQTTCIKSTNKSIDGSTNFNTITNIVTKNKTHLPKCQTAKYKHKHDGKQKHNYKHKYKHKYKEKPTCQTLETDIQGTCQWRRSVRQHWQSWEARKQRTWGSRFLALSASGWNTCNLGVKCCIYFQSRFLT